MSVSLSDSIIFSGTFNHLNIDKRADCVDFPTGAYLRELRIIPNGVEVTKHQIKGNTSPNTFLIELYVFDISTREFIIVNTIKYDQLTNFVSPIDYKMPTTTLVLRGNYKNISIVIIGVASPPFPRELRLNPNDPHLIEGNESLGFPNGVSDDVLSTLIIFDESSETVIMSPTRRLKILNEQIDLVECDDSSSSVETLIKLIKEGEKASDRFASQIMSIPALPAAFSRLKLIGESLYEECVNNLIGVIMNACESVETPISSIFPVIRQIFTIPDLAIKLVESQFTSVCLLNITDTSLTTSVKIHFIVSLITVVCSAECFERFSSNNNLQSLLDSILKFGEDSIRMKAVLQLVVTKFEIYSSFRMIHDYLVNDNGDCVESLKYVCKVYVRDCRSVESQNSTVLNSPRCFYLGPFMDSVDLIHQLLDDLQILELAVNKELCFRHDSEYWNLIRVMCKYQHGVVFLMKNRAFIDFVNQCDEWSPSNEGIYYTLRITTLLRKCEKILNADGTDTLITISHILENILKISFTHSSRISLTDVFSMGDNIDVVISVIERSFDNDYTLFDGGCGKLVTQLLVVLIDSSSAKLFHILLNRLLPVLRQIDSESLAGLKSFLEHSSKIDLSLEDCMTESVYMIGLYTLNLSQQPFGLITVLRICRDALKVEEDETDQQEFIRLSYVLNFVAANGLFCLFDLINSILSSSESSWLSFVPVVQIMPFYLDIISLCVNIVRMLLCEITDCDYLFRDVSIFRPLLRCFSLVFYLPSDSHYRNSISLDVVDIMSLFVHDKCRDYECMWVTCLNEIFSHMLISPEYYLPTLHLISLLIPPKMGHEGWEKHFMVLKTEIGHMVSVLGVSSSLNIRRSLQRVLRQLFNLGPQLGTFVTRTLVSLVCDFVNENDEIIVRGDQTMNLCCLLALELFVALVGRTEIGMCCFACLLLDSGESDYFEAFLSSLVRLLESDSSNSKVIMRMGQRLVSLLFESFCDFSSSSPILINVMPIFLKAKFGRISQSLLTHILSCHHHSAVISVRTLQLLIEKGYAEIICEALNATKHIKTDFQHFVDICIDSSNVELLGSVLNMIKLLFMSCEIKSELYSKLCNILGFNRDWLNQLCKRIQFETGLVLQLSSYSEIPVYVGCVKSLEKDCLLMIYDQKWESVDQRNYTPVHIKESFTVDKAIVKDNFEMLEKALQCETLNSCVDKFKSYSQRDHTQVYDTSGQSRGIQAYVAPMRGRRIAGRGMSLTAARSSNSSRYASLHIDEFKRLTGRMNEQPEQESVSYLTNFVTGNE